MSEGRANPFDNSALMLTVPEEKDSNEFTQALTHWGNKLETLSYAEQNDSNNGSNDEISSRSINGGSVGNGAIVVSGGNNINGSTSGSGASVVSGASIRSISSNISGVTSHSGKKGISNASVEGGASVKSSFGVEIPHFKTSGGGVYEEPDIDDVETGMEFKKPKKEMITKKKKNTLRFWLCRRRVVAPVVLACIFAVIVGVLLGTPRNKKIVASPIAASSSTALLDENSSDSTSNTSTDTNMNEGVELDLGDEVIDTENSTTTIETTTIAPTTTSPSLPPTLVSSLIPTTPAPTTTSPSLPPTLVSSLIPTTPKPTFFPTVTPVTEWEQTAELSRTTTGSEGKDEITDPTFGYSVSIAAKGNFVAVGVPGFDNGNGAVQLYAKDPSGRSFWDPVSTAIIRTDDQFEQFGTSVKLSNDGTRLAVRSLRKGFLYGGVYVMVYVYDAEKDEWRVDPNYTLHMSGTANTMDDAHQSAMAFSGEGKTVALASTTVDLDKGRSDTSSADEVEDYAQIIVLHKSLLYSISLFSTIHHSDHYLSLSHDGNRLAYTDRERVSVMEYYRKNVFIQYYAPVGLTLEATDGEDADFGSSVVLSPCGEYLAVSSRNNTKVYMSPPHGIDMYGKSTSDDLPWVQLGQTVYNLDDGHPASVSLWSQNITDSAAGDSTTTLLTLALSDAGSVRIFEYTTGVSTEWTPRGSQENMIQEQVDASFAEKYKHEGFGNSIALSQDGLTVAVGAPAQTKEDDAASAVAEGKVLIYEFDE